MRRVLLRLYANLDADGVRCDTGRGFRAAALRALRPWATAAAGNGGPTTAPPSRSRAATRLRSTVCSATCATWSSPCSPSSAARFCCATHTRRNSGMEITLRAVGTVRAARRVALDDNWGGTEATIELADWLPEAALAGLDSFSHAEIIFVFDQVEPAAIVTGARHPRNNRDWPAVGIFAQRGKKPPEPARPHHGAGARGKRATSARRRTRRHRWYARARHQASDGRIPATHASPPARLVPRVDAPLLAPRCGSGIGGPGSVRVSVGIAAIRCRRGTIG